MPSIEEPEENIKIKSTTIKVSNYSNKLKLSVAIFNKTYKTSQIIPLILLKNLIIFIHSSITVILIVLDYQEFIFNVAIRELIRIITHNRL